VPNNRSLVLAPALLGQPKERLPTYSSRRTTRTLVQALLDNGASATSRDDTGWTPLAYASAADNSGTAEVLLRAGAKPIEDELDRSPVIIAAMSGGQAVLPLLLRQTIPAGQVNELYTVAASRGHDALIATINASLGIRAEALGPLKAFLQRRLDKPLMTEGQVDSFFVLAALQYCRELGAFNNSICLRVTPANRPEPTTSSAPAAKTYRIKSSVSQDILNMRSARTGRATPAPPAARACGRCRREQSRPGARTIPSSVAARAAS
jgi:hypothetical protein